MQVMEGEVAVYKRVNDLVGMTTPRLIVTRQPGSVSFVSVA